MTPKILGISGITGAGKTTLCKALAHEFKSTSIFWDDFDLISTSPSDYVAWYHRGQDYNEWDYPALAEGIRLLKTNHPFLHPVHQSILEPSEFIIFDAPLGRRHIQTGQLIDVAIHLSTPLDVALCRRLLRDYKSDAQTKNDLLDDLQYYLSYSRPLFFDDDIKAHADLIIDGMLSLDEQVQRILEYL
ncbi:Uridine kinase [Aquicella siphonis]|uniref:Uridine kinase n=1 Tax=Aquicella siphonis TaxID=254247 RepID=A0A5E4PEU5_9COXI|nr:AAA family ATPase [Aquicella siphonis]VVC75364.1 Uridine kinase [Aquicella siphonis]